MIKIRHCQVSPFITNCYLLQDAESREAALVDPGDDADGLMAFIEESGAKIKYLLATHGHVDHIGAAADLSERLGLGLRACTRDQFLLDSIPEVCRLYGLRVPRTPRIDTPLDEGDELWLGEERLQFFAAPGHSPGSLVILAGETDLLAGDVLFAGSIGRSDLPGGDGEVLKESILTKIIPLGDALRVHPGHGPATTVAWEKANNPFLLEWIGPGDR